jgi:crotonobetainyl-CoA:carnitine CoA-transferase CaiB-like acyl-CoA transferase
MGPFPGDIPHQEKSGLFLYLNLNKQGITLNLKTKTGIDIFKELVKKSNVLVENYSARVMPSLGLDYETLQKINPNLIMTSISNYGQTGPYRDWKASEIVLYALSGQMARMGDPDREPIKHALNVFQYFAGKVASFVTVAAATRYAATGEGEFIDLSILDVMRGDIQNKIMDYAYSGFIGGRHVAKNSPIYPLGGFPVKDGYVAMQGRGGGARWVPRLFEMIERPELKNDPRFYPANNLAKNSSEFYAILYAWLIDHTKEEVFAAARKARYPVAPVYTTEEVLNNPQSKERKFFIDIDHPVAGKLTYPGASFEVSEGGFAIRRPAPLLGQHNKDIYCGLLGYSAEELATLGRAGII